MSVTCMKQGKYNFIMFYILYHLKALKLLK